ncbi:unnamed protein product [Choristocarpus tenellus]
MMKDEGKGEKNNPSNSMLHVLGEQRDFNEVVPSLQALVERDGGVCLMLPKYHCDLNPIEVVWGRVKHWLRQHCTYSLDGLRKNVPLRMKLGEDRQTVWLVQK